MCEHRTALQQGLEEPGWPPVRIQNLSFLIHKTDVLLTLQSL